MFRLYLLVILLIFTSACGSFATDIQDREPLLSNYLSSGQDKDSQICWSSVNQSPKDERIAHAVCVNKDNNDHCCTWQTENNGATCMEQWCFSSADCKWSLNSHSCQEQ